MATEEQEIDAPQNAVPAPVAAPPCPPPTDPGNDPAAQYQLPGPQVEYQAAFWLVNAKLRLPTIPEIEAKLGPDLLPYPTDTATLSTEIAELKNMASNRNQPLGGISEFIQLQKHPFGAVFNTTRDQYRVSHVTNQDERIKLSEEVVKTGRELARLFENETPGLYHHHALNWLLFNRADFSPVRHARIRAALDLTIYAALSAAWYYKWAANRTISFRQRPWEYDHSLNVLFDDFVNDKGDGNGEFKGDPCPNPGTPRHPAYPSGHSTYSAAASHLLKYFFRGNSHADPNAKGLINVPQELDKLADNIGEARLWAGVHWRSDHTFGQTLGRAVAALVIEQLEQDCVPTLPLPLGSALPPTQAELTQAEAARQAAPCPKGATHDEIPLRTNSNQEKLAF